MTPPDDVRTIEAPARPARTRLAMVDCDVHHAMRSPADLHPFLSRRWRDHLDTYGLRMAGAVHRVLAVSEGGAGPVAHRCLATGWRTAGVGT